MAAALPPGGRITTCDINPDHVADKTGYLDYYEAVLPKLAPRGVILADNVLWSGRVLADDEGTDSARDPDTLALKLFNDHVANDERVTTVMLTIRDGVSMIRRRD
ncbi:MAG: hypothetical protein LH461_04390 [Spirochaetaceae bacterium]|nr:hypothetical protein [Spirochaetaceae bacterium]